MPRARFLPPAIEQSTAEGDSTAAPDYPARGIERPGGYQPYLPVATADGAARGGRRPLGDALRGQGHGGPAANDGGPAAALEGLRARAREEGHAAGFAAGRAEALAELEALLERYRRSLESLATLSGSAVETYRGAMLDTSIAVAEAVLQGELRDGEHARALAARALEAFAEADEIELVVGPDDHAQLESWVAGRRAAGTPITLLVDDDLAPGDLRVRCDEGSLETRLQARLERAVDALRAPTGRDTQERARDE